MAGRIKAGTPEAFERSRLMLKAQWPKTARDRFMSHVEKSLAAGGCWEWTGVKNSMGYGRFSEKGRYRLAHRVSWEWANGRALVAGEQVHHQCDNRVCVNPSHLWVGTQLDNIRDAIDKGRFKYIPESSRRRLLPHEIRRGEAHGRARLNDVAVRVMRYLNARGVSTVRLARAYKVHQSLVWEICRGRLWRHVV